MSDEDLANIDCWECGIRFYIAKHIDDCWRLAAAEKSFFCPNGHSITYPAKKPSSEIDALKAEVVQLKTDLEASRKALAEQKKRADDMQLELEIWKPREDADLKVG
jgi:hypothetical protein